MGFRLLAACAIAILLGSCAENDAKLDGRTAAEWAAVLRDPAAKPADRREAALRLSTLADPAEAPALAAALKGDVDPEVRRLAAFALGNVGAKSAAVLPALREALRDKDDSVREGAAAALGSMGPDAAPAAEDLATVMKETGSIVSQQAAFALARLGPAAVAPLLAALDHADENVRARAIGALRIAAPSEPRVTEAAERLLASDPSWIVRRDAAALLGAAGGTPDARFNGLRPGLDDSNPAVVQAVAESLGAHSGPLAAEALSRGLDSEYPNVRGAIAEALGRMGEWGQSSAQRIAEGARRERGATRVKFLLALWRLNRESSSAVKSLTESLADTDEVTRQAAASALGEMGAAAAPAAAALGNALEDRAVRVRAAEALGRIGPGAAAALPALRRWAADPNEHFREVVAKAIARIEGKE